MKVTNTLKKKLEDIFEALDYKVRYERGNFKSGYCILDKQNVIVINKFFPMESKVNVLLEILKSIEQIDESRLDESQVKLVRKLAQKELEF